MKKLEGHTADVVSQNNKLNEEVKTLEQANIVTKFAQMNTLENLIKPKEELYESQQQPSGMSSPEPFTNRTIV